MINVVCGVIENTEGEVLVCQRAEGMMLEGKWEFPGGKLEQREGEREALKREILEELGCEVQVGEALKVVKHHYMKFSIRLAPYRCKLRLGSPQLLEHAALKWCAIKDFDRFDWAPADVPISRELTSIRALHTMSKPLGE